MLIVLDKTPEVSDFVTLSYSEESHVGSFPYSIDSPQPNVLLSAIQFQFKT